MDLFGRKSRALLSEAISELASLRSAIELERTNRIAAEHLAESYRLQAENANAIALRAENERADAIREQNAMMRSINERLIAAQIPHDNPGELERAKEKWKQIPKSPLVNPLRKAIVDSDVAFINNEILKSRMKPRTGNPTLDKSLEQAQSAMNEESTGKPN